MRIEHYISLEGKDVYQEWLDSIRDKIAKTAITRRIDRISLHSNFGDCKNLGDGISELRIDVGAGYRVYYSVFGDMILLLLCGGSKSTQKDDIKKAVKHLEDLNERRGLNYVQLQQKP